MVDLRETACDTSLLTKLSARRRKQVETFSAHNLTIEPDKATQSKIEQDTARRQMLVPPCW